MQKSLLFAFIFCISYFTINAQDQSVFTFEEDGKTYTIEERMAQQNAPGVSLCLMHTDGRDTTMQWGHRDAAKQYSINENTLFQVGGMSAAPVHFAVLRLVNSKQIDLDTDINQYLKSWKFPESKFTKAAPITVRDLLLQTRGFKTVSKPQGYVAGSPLPNLIQMLNGETPSQEAATHLKSNKNKSGNSAFYNNLVLQQLLEDVHQKSFTEIMQKEVLDPLGMKQSFYRATLSEEEARNAAFGHDDDGQEIEGGRRVYPELSCSGLWTTPRDFALFAAHILKAAKGEDNRFLSQKLAKASLEPEEGWRALIFFKNDNNLYWGGASVGFYTNFSANPKTGWIKMVFINANLKWKLCNEINFKAGSLVDTVK